MPDNLILVRHGQSEANVLQQSSKNGDESLYTEEMMNYPDRSWRLTKSGALQAQKIGRWLDNLEIDFDRFVVSPFVRTRETAANLNLPDAHWEENRVVRERSWGEIDSMSRQEFKRKYPVNAKYKSKDPIYWAPPAGESVANVAENRVSSFLSSANRKNAGQNVLVVTHGEFIWATRMVVESWSDEDCLTNELNPDYKILNCTAIHYTRICPATGARADRLSWVRRSYPHLDETTGEWKIVVGEWSKFERQHLSNEELLTLAEAESRRLT